MLRELATVLVDLHEGFSAAAGRWRHGIRLTHAEMDLPIDIRVVFRDGGARLLADVQRRHADADWFTGSSRLRLSWSETPAEPEELQ